MFGAHRRGPGNISFPDNQPVRLMTISTKDGLITHIAGLLEAERSEKLTVVADELVRVYA